MEPDSSRRQIHRPHLWCQIIRMKGGHHQRAILGAVKRITVTSCQNRWYGHIRLGNNGSDRIMANCVHHFKRTPLPVKAKLHGIINILWRGCYCRYQRGGIGKHLTQNTAGKLNQRRIRGIFSRTNHQHKRIITSRHHGIGGVN